MKRKVALTIILVLALLAIVSVAAACNEAAEYTVVFMDGDKEVYRRTVSENTAVNYVPDEREDAVFAGWFTDKELKVPFDGKKGVTSSVTVYGKWEPVEFTVTFLGADGETLETQTVKYGSSATAPEPPKIPGKEFLRWDRAFDSVTSDLTVTALYSGFKGKIDFCYGGSVVYTAEAEEGAPLGDAFVAALDALSDVLPAHLEFTAWFNGDTPLDAGTALMTGDNLTLEAGVGLARTLELDDCYADACPEIAYGVTKKLDVYGVLSGIAYEAVDYSVEWITAEGVSVAGLQFEYGDGYAVITGSDAAKLPFTKYNFSLNRDLGVYRDVLSIRLIAEPADPDSGIEGYTDEYIIPIRVTEGTFSVTSNPINLTYNGSAQTIDVSGFEGLKDQDSVEFEFNGEVTDVLALKNAGSYYVYYTVSRANHFDYEGSFEVRIAKAELSVKVSDAEYGYGEDVPEKPDYTTTGLFPGDALDDEKAEYAGLPVSFGKAGESYSVSVSGLVNDNYDIIYKAGTLTVVKRKIGVRVAETHIVYGEALPATYALELTSGTFAKGESFANLPEPKVSYLSESEPVNAGSYIVTIDFSEYSDTDGLNYEISCETGTLYIDKLLIDAVVNDLSTAYGKEPAPSDYSLFFPTLSASEAAALQIYKSFTAAGYDKSAAAGEVFEVGAVLTYMDGATQNYMFNVISGKLSVEKAKVTVSVIAEDLVYGSAVPGSFNLGTVNWADGENHYASLRTFTDYTLGAGVGRYYASAALKEGETLDNYEIIFAKTYFSVTPRSLQIKVKDVSVSYGDEFASPEYVVSGDGLVFGDPLTVTCSLPEGYNALSPAGQYTINAQYEASANYTVECTPGTLTVEKRAVHVFVNDRAELDSGSDWSTVVNEADNLLDGHEFSASVTLRADSAGAYSYADNGGLWDINASVTDASHNDVSANYDVDYSLYVVILSITIRHEFVDGNGSPAEWSVAYDGSSHTVIVLPDEPEKYTVKYSTNGEDYFAQAPAFTSAGTYTVYYVIASVSGTDVQEGQFVFTVEKKAVSVSALDENAVYGDAAPEFGYEATGFVSELPESAVTLRCAYSAGSDAGVYDIVVGIAEEYYSDYRIETVNGKLTVSKRKITVNAESAEIYYGDSAVYKVSVVSGSLYGSDAVMAESGYVPGSDADVYPITLRLNVNYDVTSNSDAVLTVLPRPVTVSANDVSVQYMFAAPAFEIVYGGMGLYGNDDLGATAATAYSPGDGVGSYDIEVYCGEFANYKITALDAVLTVVPQNVSVLWSNSVSVTYNGEEQSAQFCLTTELDAEPTYTYYLGGEQTEFRNAGTYTVKVDFGKNYNVLNATHGYVIARAVYDAESVSLEGVYRHNQTLADFDISDLGLSWLSPGQIPAGGANVYSAVVSDPNYITETVGITVTLEKAVIVPSVDAVTFVYDGKEHTIGLVAAEYADNGQSVPAGAFAAVLSDNAFIAPGTYAVTVEVADDPNYEMSADTLFVKVAAVDLGGVKYTIEDALYNAGQGQTITLPSGVDVSFASGAAKGAYGGNYSYYTLKAGVTMVLPSTQDAGGVGAPTYLTSKESASARYVDNNRNYINMRLTVPADVDFNVNGTVIVRGAMGYPDSGGNIYQGHTSGNHSQIINEGTITVSGGGTLDLRGYLKGGGTLYLNEGSNMYSPFVVRDFRGGTNTVTVYRKGGITPFNQFDFPNSQCTTVFGYGSELTAYFDLYASSAHNSAKVTIVGTSGKVFNLTSSGSGLIFETDPDGNHDVTFIGNVTLGSLVLTINFGIMSQTVDMGEVFFPVSYLYDIFVGDGKTQTTLTASAKYKFLPGSSMTIAENATLVTSGEVIFYKDFADSVESFSSSAAPTYPSLKAAASLSVAGTLRITGGKFGAEIAGVLTGARTEISSGASLNALSKEGHSGRTSSTQAILNLGEFVNVYTADVTSTFKETGSATISPGANYSFDGSKWNKV